MTGDPVRITVDSRAVIDRFNRIAERGGDLRRPMLACGHIVHASVETNFARQGRFQEAGSWRGGTRRWAPLADSSNTRIAGGSRKRYKLRGGERAEAKRRIAGHKILQGTGQLVSSVHVSARGNSVEIGTNKAYGAVHQFGIDDTVSVPSHERTSSRGKTYRVKSFSRKLKMPARPYLVVQDGDVDEMVGVLDNHLMS
jgi:phage gpG-like protein